MKKALFGTLVIGLLSFQAHADYVPQPQSIAAQAARYSVMSISELTQAARAGQAGAQFYLGAHYQHGKDVAKDDKQAFTWFKAAADQGLSPAQLNVGRMYADGVGVAKNESMARKYFEKAAKNGDNRAATIWQ